MTEPVLRMLAEQLPTWLPTQRWFGGKDRPVTEARPVRVIALSDKDPRLVHALVEVMQDDRKAVYQLLLGSREQPPEHLAGVWVDSDGTHWYEATADPELMTFLLDAMAEQGSTGPISFHREDDVDLDEGLRGRAVTSEQSNTSLIYGQQYILKLFRKLSAGPNPDLRIHRALHSVGCEHIAQPLGWISDEDGDRPTLGMLQQFLADAADGWAMATTSVRDLMAEGDLHADEVGGDFAGEARRLGAAVAAVHADLARALDSRPIEPGELDAAVDAMHRRLDSVMAAVPDLADLADAIRQVFDQARGAADSGVPIQHVHGDLHLGQVLRTVNGWVLIDFEGEPAAPVSERLAPRSPLRDVAGMLRSFDYAAHQLLVGQQEDHQLAVRAQEWTSRNRGAFCDGYAEISPNGDPRDHEVLLRALELDKAIYEVAYEQANRPDWLQIPLTSIARIAS
ncbi:aminoglycoside phosphotransferase [Actinosynnema sp. ALI-1.44]|uniref:maltokinase N-terminal cap-like domain-containing protein n=1 Tax=Actinosynnema sp. ALI-1.44 TaxID=1933779 RepID=UPI00097BAB50|nr:phosphotransferase [Actinosynnema sp. ALI-1.44]ONI85241.1 aminoglycoside phosphotransferase [Actinosynnema sp. ALI-1.44]